MTGSNGIMGMYGLSTSYSYYFYLKITTARQAVAGDTLALMFQKGTQGDWFGFTCNIPNPKSTPGLTHPFGMSNTQYLTNKAAGTFTGYDLGVFEFHDSYCYFDSTSYITIEARVQSYSDTNSTDTSGRFVKGANIKFAYWQSYANF